MNRATRDAVGRALGAAVTRADAVAGGDINDAFAVGLDDGRKVFVKTHARAAPGMFWCEARGLRWLAEPGALRVPGVLAVSSPDGSGPYFLVLEHLASGPRRGDADSVLGRGLAALHQAGAPEFGLSYDNFIATLGQDNRPLPTWAEFYGQRRLLPQVRLAVDRGLAPPRWAKVFDRLAGTLAELAGPEEPPARLHGDLWGGNVHTDERGAPCLIDPAVYGGHREVDLAMLALFGGMTPRVLAAYREVYPLAWGHSERVPLYQLYPLLIHVNLFGGGYVGAVDRALLAYGL